MQESRTIKSLKNAKVSFVYYTINLILGFWSRNVFYKYLGSEVLGLDTTASTLLSFLNLAELGVGSTVGYFLYKPMFDHDTHTMNEIVALQGWIYRRIAFVIIGASLILMCFFPMIFAKIELPKWYPYCTFLAMLFGSMLGYFMNYRQCVLNADQKGYKVTIVTNGASIFFKIVLILLLPVVSFPYILYISTTVLGSLFGCLWLNHVLKKEYPWLHHAELTGRQLLKKYPKMLKTTGLIFFHQICTFMVFKISPFIMYAFTSLTTVAYYGNYLVVIDKAKDILGMAFSSTGNGVGNLIASGDLKHSLEVFWELIDSRLCISFGCIFVIGVITEPLISVWLSPNYLLGNSVLFLICLLSLMAINRTTIDEYKNGFGLFQDIWAPFVEGVINLGIALVGGYYCGIKGVLLGNVASNIIIVYGWKPYYVFTKAFKKNAIAEFYLPMFGRLLLLGIDTLLFVFVLRKIGFTPTNFLQLFIYLAVLGVTIIPLVYIEFYLLTPGVRSFNHRILLVFKNKIGNK